MAALRHNCDLLAATVGPKVGVLAVIKADAYGHGALACAQALERRAWGFAVSLVEEGIELRRGGIAVPIVVLGSCFGHSHRDVLAYQLTPVVSQLDDLQAYSRAAVEIGNRQAAIHLKIDTGMARLGFLPSQLPQLIAELRRTANLHVSGLCTHLAEADAASETSTRQQLARFDAARAELARAGYAPTLVHIANSAGLWRYPEARADLVRPGLALFGESPMENANFPALAPVMRLKSKIVALRQLPPHSPVSYGAHYHTQTAAEIATVPVGYADGYSRRMSGRAEVLVTGRRCKVVGAITMDMCMVDVTELGAHVGDEVVLLGRQADGEIRASEWAEWSQTITWEIFCGISKRVPRIYFKDGVR